MGYDAKTPLEVAIVGSGPSGFYVTEALLNSGTPVNITLLEKLPCPFGLVRYGVAPDHQKLKEVTLTFESIAKHPSVTFVGNVEVGLDISLDELIQAYHIIVFTCGMPLSASLGIPGEELQGVHSASEFIGWYNGHPDYQNKVFNFDDESAIIVGQGNVAIDIARILSKSVDELRFTDITDQALEQISKSHIKKIHIVGRRGPMQAKFTTKELRELGQLSECTTTTSPVDLQLNKASLFELESVANLVARKNYSLLKEFSNNYPANHKSIAIDFFLNPFELQGKEKLKKALFYITELKGEPFLQTSHDTNRLIGIDCGILFNSTGFRGKSIPGLPFDFKAGIFSNVDSRIIQSSSTQHSGIYVSGWVKRGPQGTIGTNRVDAIETVQAILNDLSTFKTKIASGANVLIELLHKKHVRTVSFSDWEVINAREIANGKKKGKPRDKFVSLVEMLSCLD